MDQRLRARNCEARNERIETADAERWENCSNGKALRGWTLSGKRSRRPGKDHISGKCTKLLCDSWQCPVCQNHKTESGCEFGEKCAFVHREVDSPPTRKPKKTVGKGSVAVLKNSRQLGCVFQDVEPPKSNSILRKETQFSDRSAACNSQKVHCAR